MELYCLSAGREVGPTLTTSQQAGFSGVAIALVSKAPGRPGEVVSPASNLQSVPANAMCGLQEGAAWFENTELGFAQRRL